MSNQYRNNHYVPEWYQKKFLLPGETQLYYLDLNPGSFTDPRGVRHPNKALKRQGVRLCFCERDLYTRKFKSITSTEIESHFFGGIDTKGRNAIDYFENYTYPLREWGNSFEDIMRYMSMQKLRTPKGLDWLSEKMRSNNKNLVLHAMLRLQGIHSAIWTESVWLIADASESETKFIISDHPVTVYNRKCGPRSSWCRGNNDPDIWLNGTQTIFPLSMNKVLILTNLSWVRNPYQSETAHRPNSNPARGAIFKFTDVQIERKLNEQEVREINFILKSRAYRYIGAGKEEWLYPERFVSKSDWYRYGNGYLLMPDPRGVSYTTGIFFGHQDGTSSAFDEYGRQPGQPGYSGNRDGTREDWYTFHRFQGEFARLFGPYRRGRAFNAMSMDNEYDDEEFHRYHLRLEKENKNILKKKRGRVS